MKVEFPKEGGIWGVVGGPQYVFRPLEPATAEQNRMVDASVQVSGNGLDNLNEPSHCQATDRADAHHFPAGEHSSPESGEEPVLPPSQHGKAGGQHSGLSRMQSVEDIRDYRGKKAQSRGYQALPELRTANLNNGLTSGTKQAAGSKQDNVIFGPLETTEVDSFFNPEIPRLNRQNGSSTAAPEEPHRRKKSGKMWTSEEETKLVQAWVQKIPYEDIVRDILPERTVANCRELIGLLRFLGFIIEIRTIDFVERVWYGSTFHEEGRH